MNTQNDTTQYGQERADILNSMESLLQNLPTPTTGEHRVATAGFGRINNAAHPIHTSKVSTPAQS